MSTLHLQPDWIEMTVASPPSGAGGLSFSVQAGQGALCEAIGGTEHFYATLVNASGVREKVKIEARTSDTFTIATGGRGIDGGYLSGTSRTAGGYGSWATGDKVYVGVNRVTLQEYVAEQLTKDVVAAAITGNITLTSDDLGKLHRFTATGTATLPAASASLVGKTIRFKNAAYWSAQIARAGADTIDGGSANVRVPALDVVELTCVSATAWEVTVAPENEVGDIIYSAGTTRRGCVLAYGQELSKTTYAGLQSICGTLFGAETNGAGGAGSTHFRAPDLRGRVVAGKDDMGGSAANRITAGNSGITGTTLGAAGGDERVQSHNHGGTTGAESAHTHSGTTASNGAHTHDIDNMTPNTVAAGAVTGVYSPSAGITSTLSAGAHTHTFTTGAGSSHTHSITSFGSGSSQNVQPSMILNAFVKA